MTQSRGRLAGRTVFVTGVGRGQGRAIAVRAAREGADIIGVDLAAAIPGVPYPGSTPAELAETVSLVEATGRGALIEQGDVRDAEALTDLVRRGVERFGGLYGIVANAGISIPGAWDEITAEEFRDTIDINVIGVWNTVRAGAPHLVAGGGGSIVLTSSYAGFKMQPFMVHYTASKHAVTGMTRALAAELGRHGIRVNSIHPGAVETPMALGDMRARLEEAFATNPPLAAMGTTFLAERDIVPDDVADLVLFLLGDESRRITAGHHTIDAGAHTF